MKKMFILFLFTCILFNSYAQEFSLIPNFSKVVTFHTKENVNSPFNTESTPLRMVAHEFSLKKSATIIDNPNEDLTIYPNPANVGESWSIKNVPLNSTIEIYNSLGQKIGKSILSTTSVISFDESLSKGAYIVKIQYDNKVETLKLIIR